MVSSPLPPTLLLCTYLLLFFSFFVSSVWSPSPVLAIAMPPPPSYRLAASFGHCPFCSGCLGDFKFGLIEARYISFGLAKPMTRLSPAFSSLSATYRHPPHRNTTTMSQYVAYTRRSRSFTLLRVRLLLRLR
jgi:hypothetical protein